MRTATARFDLRPYQRECIAAIPESGRYLIYMATGLGKTATFSQIPRRGRVLILSHREELVTQPQRYYGCAYGVEMAGRRSNGEEVVSASVQSLARRLGRFRPDDFDMVITDECFPGGTDIDGKSIARPFVRKESFCAFVGFVIFSPHHEHAMIPEFDVASILKASYFRNKNRMVFSAD